MDNKTEQPNAEQTLLRDMFAMSALSGMLASSRMGFYGYKMAEVAYEVADAMLAARQTTKSGE